MTDEPIDPPEQEQAEGSPETVDDELERIQGENQGAEGEAGTG